MLRVWTARLGAYDGDDRLDVSRGGNDRVGVVFAPSEELRRWAWSEMQRGSFGRDTFELYASRYREEMARSWLSRRDAWVTLLHRETVTLCCYCRNPAACHRVLLAKILVDRYAAYEGER